MYVLAVTPSNRKMTHGIRQRSLRPALNWSSSDTLASATGRFCRSGATPSTVLPLFCA